MQTSHAAWGDVVLFEAASKEDAAAKLEGEDVKVEADADAMPSKIVAVAPSVLPRDVDASDIVAGEPVRRGQAARALVLATKARMMLPMLNDTLRNEAYERAIVEEVRAFAAIHGRGPRVLDIGAGTGLLSVMAARAGAREVVGCEMNGVMAAVAQDVVRANGFDGCVKILACRSTEFSLDAEEEPFDLVVTETLDSHLLREGILPSLADALDRLARPGAAVVPQKARIYAQLCNTEVGRTGVGELVVRDDKVLGLSERRTSRLPTPKDRDGHTDIKFSSRDEMHKMILLGTVEKVFDIAFADAKSIEEFIRCEPSSMISSDDKTANAVCVWWEIDVHAGSEDAPDPEPKRPRLEGDKAVQTVQTRNCPLTNMPNIPETEAQWQDHWFPVVYPLVEAGPSIEVGFGRTETEIFVQQLEWKPAPAETSAITTELNTCMDPLRLLQVVDHERQEALRGGLETLVEAQTCSTIHLWDVGSGSLVAFVAAQFEKICAVKSLETDYFSLVMWKRLCDEAFSGKVEVLASLQDEEPQDSSDRALLVCSDFCYSHLGARREFVGGLQFCLQALAIQRRLQTSCFFFPGTVTIEARLVRLHAIGKALRAPSEIRGCKHPVDWHAAEQDFFLELDIDAYEHEELCVAQDVLTLEVGKISDAGKAGSVTFEIDDEAASHEAVVVLSLRSALPRARATLAPILLQVPHSSTGATPRRTQTTFSNLATLSLERKTLESKHELELAVTLHLDRESINAPKTAS